MILHPPSGAEVKIEWSYASLPLFVFLTCTKTALHFHVRQSGNKFTGHLSHFLVSVLKITIQI